MTSKQRAYLRSLSANIDPLFQIGKSSLTPEFTNAIIETFQNKELIKIAVLKNCSDDPKEIANILQVIGKKIVLYKENKDNKQIILPK